RRSERRVRLGRASLRATTLMSLGAQEVSAGTRVGRVITSAPDRLLLILFWTCVAVAVTVTFSVFHPALVLGLIVTLVAVTWRLAPVRFTATPADVVSTLVVLVGASAWVALN